MRRLLVMSFVSLCLLWGAQAFSQVTFHFDDKFQTEEIILKFAGESYRTKLDASGAGTITIPNNLEAGYAVVYGPRSVHMFYLIPGKKQDVTKLLGQNISFAGEAKDINDYLNNTFLSCLDLGYEKEEKEFIKEWQQLPKRLQKNLAKQRLPSDFKKKESRRLYYVGCNMLLDYPFQHSRRLKLNGFAPSEAFYKKLAERIKEDTTAGEFVEYHQVLRTYMHILGDRRMGETGKSLDKLRCEVEYIDKNICDKKIKEYLADDCLSGYIKYYGVEGVDEFLPIYDRMVDNENLKKEFHKSYSQYISLEPGKKAPDFSLLDINGKQVNLSDFLGHYVYIDVWATWCGPCCQELPKFHELKNQFKDKDIQFVSISINADEKAWRNKVENDKLDGIQLRVTNKDSFRTDYKISLIPRFILIDKEGKIIESKMTRPSDPQTSEKFSSLLR